MNKRIRFKELNIMDVIKLYKIYSEEEAMKYRGSKPVKTFEDAREFVRNKIRKDKDIITIRKGVELVATKELIGTVMY